MTNFPESLRVFASTLHFYSPAAYNFLQEKYIPIMPHPSTLRRWQTTVGHEPGISEEALKSVEKLMEKAEKTFYFNLTIDEMAIRKRPEKRDCEFDGFVDLGTCEENTEGEEASNALVFMIVAVNGYFKTPVAYYLISSFYRARRGVSY